jgi:hypothetical protein
MLQLISLCFIFEVSVFFFVHLGICGEFGWKAYFDLTDIFSLKASWCDHQQDKSDNLLSIGMLQLISFCFFVSSLFPWFALRAVEKSVDTLL